MSHHHTYYVTSSYILCTRPVAGQLQELRVGRGVRERGEVGVVELEPLLGPRTTSCLGFGV